MSIPHDIAIERTSEQGLPHIRKPASHALVGGAFWRVVAGGGLAVAVAGVAVALALPSTFQVERKHTVEADSALVYAYLAAPATWADWSGVPEGSVRLVGPDLGVGAGISWAQDGTRHRLVLTAASPQSGVEYELRDLSGVVLRKGAVGLVPSTDSTELIWTESGTDRGNLLGRYTLPFQERVADKQASAALTRLSSLAEADHKQAFGTPSIGSDEPLSSMDEVPMAPGRSMEFD